MSKIIGKFNNLDNRIKRTIIGAVVVMIVLFALVLILGTINNKKISYEKLETKISSAANSYYKKYPDKLPQMESGEVEINVNTLIEKGYLKELSSYNDDNCDAKIYTKKKGEDYISNAYLICDNYSTMTLGSYILENEKIVTEKEGLYQYGEEFIYRGENINNYIEFSGKVWRILRINADGTLRIILDSTKTKAVWDDRYNASTNEYNGINDFEKSRIKDSLNELLKDEEFITTENKKWLVAKNVCIDKKDSINFSKIYSIDCNKYSEDKYELSLLQIDEYFVASIDSNCNNIKSNSCTNYNYLANSRYWTITPSEKDSSRVYVTGTSTSTAETDREYRLRVVTNLSKHALYSTGDGTKENPYKIK